MKKPIKVIFTDTHLSDQTIEINKSIWQQVDVIAKELNVGVIHAGDAFTSRRSQSLSTLVAFDDILRNFKSNLDIIAGNHDKVDQSVDESYLRPFCKLRPSVNIYESGVLLDDSVDKVAYYFLPYFSEEFYLNKLDNLIKKEKTIYDRKVLITHISVDGVKNNDKNIVKNSIKQELFDYFDLVLVGHYHNRSAISDNILYIGSTHQNNFGEDFRKGCMILYDDLTFEFKELNAPKYITELIDLTEDSYDILESLHIQYKDSKDFIRFVIYGTENETKSIDRTIYEADGIKIVFENDELEIPDKIEDVKIKKLSKSSISEKFKEFTEKEEYNDSDVGEKFLNKHLNL